MKIVIQRVARASVSVDGCITGEIGQGLCLLVGVAGDDTTSCAERLADKIVNLRIFNDENGKMNVSLLDAGGGLLVISQFTLYADCRKGRRPSFIGAAPPDIGNEIYEYFTKYLANMGLKVQTGVFGANMQVEIINDGPVTIIMDSNDLV